jgi:hypothetical protein
MKTNLLGRKCHLTNSDVAGTIVLVCNRTSAPHVGIELPNGHVIVVDVARIVLLNNFNAVE